MAVVKKRLALPVPVEQVWERVTSPGESAWRSDLKGVEAAAGGSEFVEIDKSGIVTRFRVVECAPCRVYALELENENMRGSFRAAFSRGEGGETVLNMAEEARPKKPALHLVIGLYLRAQQHRYARDLKRVLGV